jgi:hypothetical protein
VELQGIPDGIGFRPGAEAGTVDVYVNHEETHVPFFGTADFQDASVTGWTLNGDGEIVGAEVAIPSSAGYLRFCSSFMAGPGEGFSTYTYFTNEETNDVVDVPSGVPYRPDPSVAPQRQAGYAVALNTDTGEYTQIAGMGRYNHENTVAIPGGWNQFALLSTDDTFSAPSSQLYMYLANQEQHIWQDKGSLWAFQVTRTDEGRVDPFDPYNGANDYLDIDPGDDWQGRFIRVPEEIAKDPPQTALENWSNENNVFQFIRLEDLTYDRNNPRVVYVSDTGATRVVPDPATGRMQRGPSGTVGQADSGSVFAFEFNAKNPRKVDHFWVLAQGDDTAVGAFVGFHNPDNLGTSEKSLMVQEDTGPPNPNSRIWRYDLATEAWSVVAQVTDDGSESSGIVDASHWYGDGAWLLDIQAHDFWVEHEPSEDGSYTKKQEAGQLLIMTIPGT